MSGLTQSQIDTVKSVKNEFDAMPEPQRTAAYAVLAMIAKMKWPNENFEFGNTKPQS